MKTKKLRIKNMHCNCCIHLVKIRFKEMSINIIHIEQGIVIIEDNPSVVSTKIIVSTLFALGMSLIESQEEQIVDNTKLAIIELIHHLNNVDSVTRKSEYLVEKLNMSYDKISRIFSRNEPITLERYIINQKIDRTKELVLTNEFSLSEIAYMMDYSSVQHLSGQFKKITGYTVSEYKNK